MNELKKVYNETEWNKDLKGMSLNKQKLNEMVMEYLVIEGFQDVAHKFALETGIDPKADMEAIQRRMEIRTSIESGNIQEAIYSINELDAEILDTNPDVYFKLQLQILIELVRNGTADGVKEALQFARTELAPRCFDNPEYLSGVEEVMGLLVTPQDGRQPELLHFSQRQNLASYINSVILSSQGKENKSKLPHMVKSLVWSELRLSEKAIYPTLFSDTSMQS